MSLRKFTNITQAELKAKGVTALADKPNVSSSYGVGGLSTTNLKLWFDKIGAFIAEKLNTIQDALSSDNAAEYIKLNLQGLDEDKEAVTGFLYSLQDLCDALEDGKLAAYLQIYPNVSAEELQTLQAVINSVAASISALNTASGTNLSDHETIRTEIESEVATHSVDANTHADIRTKIGTDIETHNTNNTAHSTAMGLKFDKENLMATFSGEDVSNTAKAPSAKALNDVITTINGAISTVNGKAEQSIINISYDSATGVIVFTKNNGDTITYDLPSEKILKSGASYYDATTKKLHLLLMDDSEIEIDVSALVDEYSGDNTTIELYTENNTKKFKLKDSLKLTIESHTTSVAENAAAIADRVKYDDIIDTLVSENATKPLSAKQGKALNDELALLTDTVDDTYTSVSYDNSTGQLKLTKVDGTVTTISLPLESFVSSASFNSQTNTVTLSVANGQSISFDLSALIDYYYGDGTTIEVYDDANDNYKHKIRVKSTFLSEVNSQISALQGRMEEAETDIGYLERIDELGSIGKADTNTITMDPNNGDLSARKLKLADNTILDFVSLTKATYDALATKGASTLYIIDDSGRLVLALGSKVLYSSGVKDTETNSSITFRYLTESAYNGLATKDSGKLYIINKDNALALAFGDLYINTNTALIAELDSRADTMDSLHTTLTGGTDSIMFTSLTIEGVVFTGGTLNVGDYLEC